MERERVSKLRNVEPTTQILKVYYIGQRKSEIEAKQNFFDDPL